MNDYEKDHLERLRKYLPECTVLLRYNGKFPVDSPCKVALYGSGARQTIKGGTGSGEVNSRFFVTVEQGLKDAGFTVTTSDWLDKFDSIMASAHKRFVKEVKRRARRKNTMAIMEGMGAIMTQPEYDLPLNFDSDIAVYVLSRISGEGSDREYIKGDILLTDSEIRYINELNDKYDRFLLVLNVGGPVDLSHVSGVGNVLLLSQLGVETGSVLADIILGKAYPSGKLATTWSNQDDYCSIGNFGDRDDTYYKEGIYVGYRYFDSVGKSPDFEFGYGLGFTTFRFESGVVELSGEVVNVTSSVTNTGSFKGKETLQLYVSLPQGKLDQPYQVLAAFNKTDEIGPGQTTKIDLSFCLSDIASYDPTCESYVLEEGKYVLRLGTSSKNTTVIGGIQIDETVTVRTVKNLLGDPGFVDYKPEAITDKISDVDYLNFDSSSISLQEVTYDKPCDIDRSFAEGLSDEELAYLVVGGFDPEGGFLSVIGNASMSVAGAAGETTGLLKEKGIKPVVMADGPAGVRISKDYIVRDGKVLSLGLSIPETMQEYIPKIGLLLMKIAGNKPRKGEQIRHQYCTAIPIGTAIAQSWNSSFARICGDIVGEEMERFGVHLWLAPALNIHRDIRCGRNFEYYSEDPLISGVMSAAITNGVQAHKGCGVTIKHFCANNQETNRYNSNSRVSERAMREIYLKGFEICVKNSSPASVMTSYNLLNGMHTSESGPLIRNILRDEFGFEGIVMTDWIVNGGTVDKTSVYPAPEAWKVVNAGGDLFMPGGKPDYDVVLSAVKDGRVTREQLITNAARVINYSNMVR